MLKFPKAVVLTAVALTGFTSLGVAPLAQAKPNDFAQELLSAHNHHRAEADVPALRWSPKLAKGAQKWANYLAKTGRFQHATLRQRDRAGENLLQVSSFGQSSLTDYVNVWAAEKKNFVPGRHFSNRSSKSGNWADVGHYSQVVWKQTTQVGCGIAQTPYRKILVCRYDPAGNIIGQLPW